MNKKTLLEIREACLSSHGHPWRKSTDQPDDVVIWGEAQDQFIANVGDVSLHDKEGNTPVFDMTERNAHFVEVASEHMLALVNRVEELELAHERICNVLGLVDEAYGQGSRLGTIDDVVGEIKRLVHFKHMTEEALTLREKEDYHDDDGDVVWYKYPIEECPYVGTPLDDNFPEYMTHWHYLQNPIYTGE